MRIYTVKDRYIKYINKKYLRKIDYKVLKNKDEDEHKRPYVGVIAEFGDFKYLIPLSSPKYMTDFTIENYGADFLPSDFPNPEKYRVVKKYHDSIPIMYLEETDNKGNVLMYGKLKFSSMIPLADNTYEELNIDEQEEKYKNLILKDIHFIKSNWNTIVNKHAKVIYKQKFDNINKKYIQNATVDFKKLEEGCKLWAFNQMSITLKEKLLKDKVYYIIENFNPQSIIDIKNGIYSKCEGFDKNNFELQKITIYAKDEFGLEKNVQLVVKVMPPKYRDRNSNSAKIEKEMVQL